MKRILSQIHIGGSDVENEKGHYINIEIDFENMNLEQALDYLTHASSPRVKAQSKLRTKTNKELVEDIKKYKNIKKIRIKKLKQINET